MSFKKELYTLIKKYKVSRSRSDMVWLAFVEGAVKSFEKSLEIMRDTSPEEILPAKKKPKKFTYANIDLKLAEYLFKGIQANNPNAKAPNMESWADDIRKLRILDNRPKEDIKNVIEWSQKDSFWSSNILSARNLRKHFDKLVIQSRNKASENKEDTGPLSQMHNKHLYG